jgi:hypothetical protein
VKQRLDAVIQLNIALIVATLLYQSSSGYYLVIGVHTALNHHLFGYSCFQCAAAHEFLQSATGSHLAISLRMQELWLLPGNSPGLGRVLNCSNNNNTRAFSSAEEGYDLQCNDSQSL